MLSAHRRPKIAGLLALSSVLLLTACGHTPPEVIVREHYIFAEPDPSLRKCMDRPGRPVLNDSADEAELIERLDARGNDCADRLGATWTSIDDARARAEELNRGSGN